MFNNGCLLIDQRSLSFTEIKSISELMRRAVDISQEDKHYEVFKRFIVSKIII